MSLIRRLKTSPIGQQVRHARNLVLDPLYWRRWRQGLVADRVRFVLSKLQRPSANASLCDVACGAKVWKLGICWRKSMQ